MRRIVLIARREVTAYASVPSFWVALLMGPLLMALAALGAGSLGARPRAPAATPIALVAADPGLAAAAAHALGDAARLEHRLVAVRPAEASKDARSTLRLATSQTGAVTLKVEGERLSDLTLALLRRDLAAADRAGAATDAAAAVQIVQPAPPPAPAADPGRLARFSMTTLLWLVLVGSLGMLLQAVVRERSNRALESLLAAVRPREIVLGKLVGVGALSVLVVGAWLAGGALIAATPLGQGASGAGVMLQAFADPARLAAAAALFVLAFAMYGAALIGLGALARDVTAAQNLSRPVFGVLLAVFFVALGQLAGLGGGSLPVLALVPPLAPFVLMLAKPGSIDALHATVALAGMALTTGACVGLASVALKGELRWSTLFGKRGALRPV